MTKFKKGDCVKKNPMYRSLVGPPENATKITSIKMNARSQSGIMVELGKFGYWDSDWVILANKEQNFSKVKKYLGLDNE